MTEKDAAREALLAVIPAELRDDYLSRRAAAAELDAEIEALQARRKVLYSDMEAIRALATEQAAATDDLDSDRALVALLPGGSAHAALDQRVRALHPYIFNFQTWAVPTWETLRGEKYPAVLYMAPHLALTSVDDIRAEEAEPLAVALVEFARRFVLTAPVPLPTESPEGAWDYPGYVYADILAPDTGESHSLALWYAPDGSDAVLIDERSYSSLGENPLARGPLNRVINATFAAVAQIAEEQAQDDYRY